MTDPIVEAISNVVTAVMRRGVSIQPEGEGWVVRLVPEEEDHAQQEQGTAEGHISRSW